MAARLRRREAYFRSLVRRAATPSSSSTTSSAGDGPSPALARSARAGDRRLVGRSAARRRPPRGRPGLAAALPAAPADEPTTRTTPSAGLRSAACSASRTPTASGASSRPSSPTCAADSYVGAVVLHCRDMTDRHAREQVLHSVAYTDPATGLPNRAGFLRALERAARRATRPAGHAAAGRARRAAAAREHVGREAVTARGGRGRPPAAGHRARRGRRRPHGQRRASPSCHGRRRRPAAWPSRPARRPLLSVVEQPVVTAEGIIDLTGAIGGLRRGELGRGVFHRADLAVRAAHEAATGTAASLRHPRWARPPTGGTGCASICTGACADGELFLLFEPIVSLDRAADHGRRGAAALAAPRAGRRPARRSSCRWPSAPALTGELRPVGCCSDAMTAVAAPPRPAGSRSDSASMSSTGYVGTGTLVADVEAALRSTGLAPERLVLEIS